ncbi:MAG: hypothetical protein GQE15_39280 [Archangiaceae bacterium]|nr:hypothetical protein [Archangiaceae bacterium]
MTTGDSGSSPQGVGESTGSAAAESPAAVAPSVEAAPETPVAVERNGGPVAEVAPQPPAPVVAASLEGVPPESMLTTGPIPLEPSPAPDDERTVAARQIRRMSRAFVGVTVALSVFLFAQRVLEPVDLAAGKPWRTSSKWIDCDPSIGRCGPHVTRILFHTNEDDNPWFEIDLGTPTKFSSVTVVNRSDHMPEREVPLIIEVGDDRETWKEIARQDSMFSTWRAKVPGTTARFVRFRVPRRTYFHLEAVRIHP